MTDPVMLDTDVVIDYLQNCPDAIAFIHSLSSAPMLSVVTVAELYRGVRDGRERDELDQLVADSVLIPLEWQSAVAGGLYERQCGRTHGVGFADALDRRPRGGAARNPGHVEQEALPDAD